MGTLYDFEIISENIYLIGRKNCEFQGANFSNPAWSNIFKAHTKNSNFKSILYISDVNN